MKTFSPILPLLVLLAAGTVAAQPRKPERAPDSLRAYTLPTFRIDSNQAASPLWSSIRVVARSSPDSIVLRWGITSPAGWWTANRIGFRVERIEVGNTAIPDSTSRVELLTPEPLIPWTVEQWRAAGGETNTMMGVAAQAVHGQFFTTEMTNGPAEALRNRSDEFRTRWGFAMLAADVEPRAAEGLALRYVDRAVTPGSRYIYRVSISGTPSDTNIRIDPGIVIKRADADPPVPAPTHLRVRDTAGYVSLWWDNIPDTNGAYFSGYYIERAGPGSSAFERITKDPVISIANTTNGDKLAEEEAKIARYVDSLGIDQPHRYRVRGITPFGEISPASNEVQAELHDRTPPPAPFMMGAQEGRPGTVTVQWRVADTVGDLKGFHVARSTDFRGPYKRITTALLPATTTTFEDLRPLRDTTNYYVVEAVDEAGNASQSMSAYAFMIDSTPPARPLSLKGTVDTNGVVKLAWVPNRERDIMGYRVYRTNSTERGYEMIQVTVEPVAEPRFTDTIVVRTLTRDIFYTVVAVDRNYNNSLFSDTLRLERPDLLAPVPPVFVDATVSDTAVMLQWQPSTSRDVKSHQLYRRAAGESAWRSIGGVMGRTASAYTDRDVRKRVTYEYMLTATDSTGLRSDESVPFAARPYDLGLLQNVGGVRVAPNTRGNALRLTWQYPKQPKESRVRFVVYRAAGAEKLMQFTAVAGDLREFVDRDVTAGESYTYAVRALSMADGSESPLGAAVTAKLAVAER